MTKYKYFPAVILTLFGILLHNTAWSGASEYRACVKAFEGDDYNKSIVACGAAIEAGDLTDEQISNMYVARGSSYNFLRLDAKEAGDEENSEKLARKALGDYNKAIALDDKTYSHFYNRGLLLEYTNNYEKAILDYQRALELGELQTGTIKVQQNEIDVQDIWQKTRVTIEERLERTEEKLLALPQRPKFKMYFLSREDQKILEQGLEANWEGENEQAYNLFSQCADNGHPQCMWTRGLMHAWGRGTEKDKTQAVEWFEKSIEAGYTHGMIELGSLYRDGKELEKDIDRAIQWYQKAVESGEPDGYVAEGLMHYYGNGVPENKAKGMKLIKTAAKKKSAWGQNVYGLAHQSGKFLDKDMAAAIRWYKKAAKQGHSDAQLNLALAYTFGKGVIQDPKKAVKWYKLAAVQGETQAMFNLGVSYHNGKGVGRNNKKARVWWRKAAQLGHKQAQKVLGGEWN